MKKLISLLTFALAILLLGSTAVQAKEYVGEDKIKPIASFYDGGFMVYQIKDNVFANGQPQYFQ